MYLLGAIRWVAKGKGSADGSKDWAAVQLLIDRDLPRAEKRTFAFNKTRSTKAEVATRIAAGAAYVFQELIQVAVGKPRRRKGSKRTSWDGEPSRSRCW